MSLKSKIEAVIYASEEPVTLAQLIELLSEEALQELTAQAAARAAEQAELELAQQPASSAGAETATGTSAETAADDDALDGEVLTPDAEAPEAAAQLRGEAAEAAAAELAAQVQAANAAADEASARAEARARERELKNFLRAQVDALIADYANGDRGIEVREVAGGFRFSTKAEYHDAVRGFIKSLKPPMKLSLPALETLAVIAYKQPITAPEISEVRGVDSGGVVGSLMARKLVTTAGRKQVIGRPILYKTTKDFLVRFGLKDINELPSIEEFEKMAGELADMEPTQESIPMDAMEQATAEDSAQLREAAEAAEPMAAEHEPQADGDPDATFTEADQNGPAGNEATAAPSEEYAAASANEEDATMQDYNEEDPEVTDDRPADPDDAVIDGRISGLDPDYSKDVEDNPSAAEAEEQEQEAEDKK